MRLQCHRIPSKPGILSSHTAYQEVVVDTGQAGGVAVVGRWEVARINDELAQNANISGILLSHLHG